MSGYIYQLNVSDGGVPKLPIEQAEVTVNGLAGDRQRDTVNHGGPERALCIFALESIEAMQADGHPIGPGSTGENITTRGLDWTTVVPGVQVRIGDDVVIEVTKYTTPCRFIAGSFSDGDFNRMNVKLHPANSRVYARILSPGLIRRGDRIEVLPVAKESVPASGAAG